MSTQNSGIKHTWRLHERESRVILFGNPSDPEIAESMRKLKNQGREVHTKPRPDFDTGLGPCNKQLCHCKGICMADYSKDQTV